RRERLRHEAAKTPVVVAVLVQHVVFDEREGLGHPARRRLELCRVESERRIAYEALVVEQHAHDVVMPRDEPDRRLAVDAGLAEDGIALAHLREGLVRSCAEPVAIEVVLPCGGHGASSYDPARSSSAHDTSAER